MVDADGATKISDVERLEEALSKLAKDHVSSRVSLSRFSLPLFSHQIWHVHIYRVPLKSTYKLTGTLGQTHWNPRRSLLTRMLRSPISLPKLTDFSSICLSVCHVCLSVCLCVTIDSAGAGSWFTGPSPGAGCGWSKSYKSQWQALVRNTKLPPSLMFSTDALYIRHIFNRCPLYTAYFQ